MFLGYFFTIFFPSTIYSAWQTFKVAGHVHTVGCIDAFDGRIGGATWVGNGNHCTFWFYFRKQYINRLPVNRLTMRCQRVRRGDLLWGGSRPPFPGGGFSGCGLPSDITPRRSSSMSIMSRMVSSSSKRSSANCMLRCCRSVSFLLLCCFIRL